MPSKLTLTSDQQEACNKFLGFLLSKEKEFYLFGAAGCGKTFLTQYFLSTVFENYKNCCKLLNLPEDIKSYALTATTNKAVEVLQRSFPLDFVSTIYKTMGVTVLEDYNTGEVKLHQYEHGKIENTLLIIDECSMLSKEMLNIIRKRVSNTSKVVFVGDNYQLAPVNEKAYWNETPEPVTSILTTPVRNNSNKALISLCAQLRDTVDTQVFKNINLVPGSIEHLTKEEAKNYLDNEYDNTRAYILCYTNSKVIEYQDYLKNLYKLPNEVIQGNQYINSSNCTDGKKHLYSEELVRVIYKSKSKVINTYPNYAFTGNFVELSSVYSNKVITTYIPQSLTEIKRLKKEAKKNKHWKAYFFLQNNVADLRLPYASTVHKAQGSTYDEVLIDLDSFNSCWDKDVAARLLYVAVSRAKHRVLFFGSLPKRFGELV